MATFSYKGETSTKIYEFTVVPTTSNFEKASYLYDEFDSYTRLDISGYVVSKDVYNDSYGNTTIYIVDDEGICGNMVYHIRCDKETYDALTFGTHITVYNVFNYKYLECLEAVCDNLSYFTIDKNIPIKTADELIMPIDYELISNYSYLHYRPYQLVSLTGWKVKDINKSNEFPYSRGTDLITVVKGGVEISLCVPKWIAVKESNLLTLYTTIEELSIGDIVNIKGILGYENRNHIQKDLNSYKIYVTDGESIVINSSYDSSFDTTNILNANDIKLAINYTHNVMYFNEHNKYEIRFLKDNNTESQKIELVKFVDGVSVEWEISTNERFGAPKAVSLTDKEIVINYTEEPERVVLVATFTKGDITFIQYYFIIINVA